MSCFIFVVVLCLVCLMLPVSLDCPLLNVPSVCSDVYYILHHTETIARTSRYSENYNMQTMSRWHVTNRIDIGHWMYIDISLKIYSWKRVCLRLYTSIYIQYWNPGSYQFVLGSVDLFGLCRLVNSLHRLKQTMLKFITLTKLIICRQQLFACLHKE